MEILRSDCGFAVTLLPNNIVLATSGGDVPWLNISF